MGPDVVYPLRGGSWNEELRFSLRSVVKNLPHNRIIIVGGKPSWLRPSEALLHLPREQHRSKWQNSIGNVAYAIENVEGLSDPFLLFNDDFYVLRPIERMPVYTQGLLSEVIGTYQKKHHTGTYWKGMCATYELLKSIGILNPLSYGLHLPLAIYGRVYLDAIEQGKGIEALHMRTLYGNLAGLGGIERDDVKVHHKPKEEWPTDFLSSNDDLHLNGMGQLLRDLFPGASPHELD